MLRNIHFQKWNKDRYNFWNYIWNVNKGSGNEIKKHLFLNSPVSTVLKKDIIILLPYLGVQSVQSVQSDQISERLKSISVHLSISR